MDLTKIKEVLEVSGMRTNCCLKRQKASCLFIFTLPTNTMIKVIYKIAKTE